MNSLIISVVKLMFCDRSSCCLIAPDFTVLYKRIINTPKTRYILNRDGVIVLFQAVASLRGGVKLEGR